MTEHKQRDFWDKFWNDKHGHFVVWQTPNIPLWVWIGATVIGMLLPNGGLEHFVGLIGKIAIIIWAFMEVIWGVNYFRRLLGLVVILLPLVVMFY